MKQGGLAQGEAVGYSSDKVGNPNQGQILQPLTLHPHRVSVQCHSFGTASMRKTEEPTEPTTTKMIQVCLWLRVENNNNNKYIRSKKKARDEIEQWVLSRYRMEKPRANGWEYLLSISYQTDEDLGAIIYDDIMREADRIADSRHCFIEADVSAVDDPDRRW